MKRLRMAGAVVPAVSGALVLAMACAVLGGADAPSIVCTEVWSQPPVSTDPMEVPEIIVPGKGVLTCVYDKKADSTTFRLRSLEKGQVVTTFTRDGFAGRFAVDPAGSRLAVSFVQHKPDRFSTVVYEMPGGKVLAELPPSDNVCGALAISADGHLLLSGSDGRVLLYDLGSAANGAPPAAREVGRLKSGARTLEFSADGRRAVAAEGPSLLVIDIGTGKSTTLALDIDTAVPNPPAGAWRGFYGINLVNWDTGRLICRADPKGDREAVRYTVLPGQRTFLAHVKAKGLTDFSNQALVVFSAETGEVLHETPLSDKRFPVVLAQDGRSMVTLDVGEKKESFLDMEVTVPEGPIRFWRIDIKADAGPEGKAPPPAKGP